MLSFSLEDTDLVKESYEEVKRLIWEAKCYADVYEGGFKIENTNKKNKKLEKVYAVEFMAYTNCLKDTVSDWDGISSFIGKEKYLTVKGPKVFLIKESDLEKYSKYGQGYKDLSCIGWMEV